MNQEVKRKKLHLDRSYAILRDAKLSCLEKMNAMYSELKDYEFYKG